MRNHPGPGAEISRMNGRKGGRKPFSGERAELRELCRREGPEIFARLKHLAYHGELESTRQNGLALMAAYAFGKPAQVVTGADGGNVILQLVSGVATPDDFGNWEPKAIAPPDK